MAWSGIKERDSPVRRGTSWVLVGLFSAAVLLRWLLLFVSQGGLTEALGYSHLYCSFLFLKGEEEGRIDSRIIENSESFRCQKLAKSMSYQGLE